MSALLQAVAQATKAVSRTSQALRGEFIMHYTAKRILEGNSNMTAIASEIGVAPTAVRHHIIKLADMGLVERKLCYVWGYPLNVFLPTDGLAEWIDKFKPVDGDTKYEQRTAQILSLFDKTYAITSRYVANSTGISVTAVQGHLTKLYNEGKIRRAKRAGSKIWYYTLKGK